MFITPGSRAKAGGKSFPSGTTIPFYQAAAPLGWTKVTTQNDKALRVVSGSGGVAGGTNSFSTVMAQTAVGGFTLTTNEMPSHGHPQSGSAVGTFNWYNANGHNYPIPTGAGALQCELAGGFNNAGSGASHNHTITMAMQYIDVIIASKN